MGSFTTKTCFILSCLFIFSQPWCKWLLFLVNPDTSKASTVFFGGWVLLVVMYRGIPQGGRCRPKRCWDIRLDGGVVVEVGSSWKHGLTVSLDCRFFGMVCEIWDFRQMISIVNVLLHSKENTMLLYENVQCTTCDIEFFLYAPCPQNVSHVLLMLEYWFPFGRCWKPRNVGRYAYNSDDWLTWACLTWKCNMIYGQLWPQPANYLDTVYNCMCMPICPL